MVCRDFARPWLLRLATGIWILLSATAARVAADQTAAFEPQTLFTSRCSGCHSVGQGDVVGPDLAGVGARHERPWLRAFIRSSQAVIRSGDAAAVALYARYGKTMPDHDLGDAELDRLLDWLAAGGPRPAPAARAASEAAPEEVALGRDLFLGRARFAAGGVACAHCHTAGEVRLAGGGSLGGDLTGAYGAHGDWGLDRAIGAPRSPLMAEVYARRALSERESFAVRAFLHHAWREPEQAAAAFPAPGVPLLGFGSSALVLWLARREPRARG